MRSIRSAVVAITALVGAWGCASTYYRVTDPTTGRAYYTTSLKERGTGSVQLHDAGTGKTVTLQNTEVQKVTKEEFETGKVRSTLVVPGAAGALGTTGGLEPTRPSTLAPINAVAVEGVTWQLVEVAGRPAEPIRADERASGFRLNAADKRVSGYGGVNQLSGPYELNGTALKFGELAMTRRAGSEPLMLQESTMSQAMEQTDSWQAVGQDEIALLDAAGRRLARFKRAGPPEGRNG